MTSIIIGHGEIGKAVHEIIGEAFIVDKKLHPDTRGVKIDIMHVCIPYSSKFISDILAYEVKYKPKHIIIYSTVAIGTTRFIKRAVHSPIEGKHPELAQSIRDMKRWIGTNSKVQGDFFAAYFRKLNIVPRIVNNSDHTEALKLLSTTEYGINIEFARYKKKVADEIGMKFGLTKKWNKDYNKLYHNLGLDWAQKYILDAPAGPKGGHCVTPNARILYQHYPDELVKIVGEL